MLLVFFGSNNLNKFGGIAQSGIYSLSFCYLFQKKNLQCHIKIHTLHSPRYKLGTKIKFSHSLLSFELHELRFASSSAVIQHQLYIDQKKKKKQHQLYKYTVEKRKRKKKKRYRLRLGLGPYCTR